jgi:hypothetical protein
MSPAIAAQKEIGSCYEAIKLDDVVTPKLNRELFVIVDQTVEFDKGLQEQVYQKIMKFLTPGDRVVIVSFSAYVADRYTDVVFDGVVDARLKDDNRYDISKKVLRVLDKCYQVQETGVRQGIGQSLISIFQNASTNLPNTELIGNLSLLGRDVMRSSQTDERYVLIVSDMLEHSAITSFYRGGKLKIVDAPSEIAKVKKAGMIADFNGAKVYMAGAGYSLKGVYRSAVEMKSIEGFWQAYFQEANAQVAEFGSPALISEIGH